MKILISNLLSHTDRTVELEPGVTVLSGPNSAGKTTIATILGALSTLQSNPLEFSAAEKKGYITDGKTDGFARLMTEEGSVSWYPLILNTESSGSLAGRPLSVPQCSGLLNFLEKRDLKKRAAIFEGLFPAPKPEDLLRGKIPDAQLAAVCQVIGKSGWDAALAIYENKRKDAKGTWSKLTGAGTYGAQKAANWVPPDWRLELAGESMDSLREKLQSAKDQLHALNTQEAIDQEKINTARKVKYDQIPTKEKELAEQETARDGLAKLVAEGSATITNCNARLAECEAEIQRVKPVLDAKADYECPACQVKLVPNVDSMRLEIWQEPTPEQYQQAHDVREEQQERIEAWKGDRTKHQLDLDATRIRLNAAVTVVHRLEGELRALQGMTGLADVQAKEGANPLEITQAEETRDACQKDHDAKDAMVNATRAHEQVVELDSICKVLSSQGARWEQAQGIILHINNALRTICEKAGWGPVEVNSSYGLTYNKRAVLLCAENERLKTQLALQLAFAMIYKPVTMVILDAVDKLHDDSRNGLLDMLARVADVMLAKRPEFRIIVCGTNLHQWGGVIQDRGWPVKVLAPGSDPGQPAP